MNPQLPFFFQAHHVWRRKTSAGLTNTVDKAVIVGAKSVPVDNEIGTILSSPRMILDDVPFESRELLGSHVTVTTLKPEDMAMAVSGCG